MRAITVRQPWAWAIIGGGKDVENRTRNIAGSYRGPVAIHVARQYAVDADPDFPPLRAATDRHRRLVREPLGTHPAERPWNDDLGAIIGVVDLVDVHWSGMECSRADIPCHEYALCSSWAQAYHHHLVLANPRVLATPIPWRGALGLWTLPDDVLASAL